jgi:hypothetical protein
MACLLGNYAAALAAISVSVGTDATAQVDVGALQAFAVAARAIRADLLLTLHDDVVDIAAGAAEGLLRVNVK